MPLAMQRLSVLTGDLDHPAALAVQADRTIWSAGESGQIYSISADGKRVSEVACVGKAVLSLALSADDRWLAVGYGGGLSKLDLSSSVLETIPNFEGVPGGLCFLVDGTLLMTERSRPAKGRLLSLSADGEISELKTGALADPRGVAVNAEETLAFIVCRGMPGVMVCPIEAGVVGKAQPFVELPLALPESIVLDARSNLYVGCHAPSRIYKVAPDKWVSVHAEDPRMELLSQPAGLAWTGKVMDQILAANRGGRHITQIDMKLTGLGGVNQR